MHTSILSTVVLPITLSIIMLGLGLSLTTADFRRTATDRRAVLVTLGCQMLVLPAACLALIAAVRAGPDLAVGLLLLAASPGGTLAAVYSKLAGGDVALNITVTALNSTLSVLTLPLIVWAATSHYYATGSYIGLQPGAVTTMIAVVLVPVALGMLVRRYRPGTAATLHRPVRLVSIVVLAAVIAGSLAQNLDGLGHTLRTIVPTVVIFSVLNLTLGYWLPRFAGLARSQAIAAAMEIGVHNSALAITIAVSPALLGNPAAGLTPAIYALISFVTAGVAALLLAHRGAHSPASRMPRLGRTTPGP